MKTHLDGSICLEGTQRIKPRTKFCCERFEHHTWACEYDIRFEYWSRRGSWYTIVPEAAGGGGIKMKFCPFCGARLQLLAPAKQGTSTRSMRRVSRRKAHGFNLPPLE
jgi:hypothetical protein